MNFKLGEHPRLIAGKGQIEKIRKKVKNSAPHSEFYRLLRDKCDKYLLTLNMEYRFEDESDGWQRAVGNALMNYTAAYAAGGDVKYLNAAVNCAEKVCSYPTWGRGHQHNSDLSAAHELFGISMLYDWFACEIPKKTSDLIKKTALSKAADMYRAAEDERTFWSVEWLQNHMWVDLCALSAAAVTFYEEALDADQWLSTVLHKFGMTMKALSNDGASHEGYLYWQYGTDWMIKFMTIAKDNLGVDLFGTEWFKNTADYGIYLLLPANMHGNGENIYADMADSDRCNKIYFYEGNDHLLYKLASIYRNGYAQAAAREITALQLPITSWKCLFYYDETVEETPLSELADLKYFEDMGIVADRSGWDGNESLLLFRCAPYMGHSAFDSYNEPKFRDWGGGHVHPDVNHFTLFGGGETIMADDGYAHKQSSNHSVLLVDGHGQAGEGWIWFGAREAHMTGGKPQILHMEQGEGFDFFICDGTYAYPAHLGLKKYIRRFLFVKPNVLLVADDIETDEIRCMELRMIPGAAELFGDDLEWFAKGEKTLTRIVSTYPVEAAEKARYLGRKTLAFNTPELAENKNIFIQTIRDDKWRTASVISFAPVGQDVPEPEISVEDGIFTMTLDGKVYVMDTEKNEIGVQ